MLQRQDLSSDNQEFLDLLKSTCELQSGRITLAEYEAWKETWTRNLTGIYALGQRLEFTWRSLIQAETEEEMARLTLELRKVTAEVIADERVSEPTKIHAQITQLYSDGQWLSFRLTKEVLDLHLRLELDPLHNPLSALQPLAQITQEWKHWVQAMNGMVRQAEEQRYPILIAEALTGYATVVANCCSRSELHFADSPHQRLYSKQELIAACREAQEMAERAAEIYQKANHVEGELRAKLAIVELLYLCDQKEASVVVAKEVYDKAIIMGYTVLAEQSKGHAGGVSRIEEELERFRTASEDDFDALKSADDDEAVRRRARSTLEALRMPPDRLRVLEHDFMAERDIARERMNWCRYIVLAPDTRHPQDPSTVGLIDPDRRCQCTQYNYESSFGHSDYKAVISAFKQSRCIGCPGRNPKI